MQREHDALKNRTTVVALLYLFTFPKKDIGLVYFWVDQIDLVAYIKQNIPDTKYQKWCISAWGQSSNLSFCSWVAETQASQKVLKALIIV